MVGTVLLALLIGVAENPYKVIYQTTKHGHASLMRAKLVTLLNLVAGMTFVTYLTMLCYAGLKYGFGDILRPIQSISVEFPLRVSVLGYLILQMLWHLLVQWHVAVLMLACSLLRGAVFGIGLFSALLLLGIVPFQNIPDVGSLGFLKYCNLFSAMDPDAFLCKYCNVNFFGEPVSMLQVGLIFNLVCLLLLQATCFYLMEHENDQRVVFHQKLSFTRVGRKHGVSLFRHELWNLMVGKKGIALCIAMIDALAVRYCLLPQTPSVYEKYKRTVIEQANEQEDPQAWMEEEYEKEVGSGESLRALALLDVMEQNETVSAANIPDITLLYTGGYEQWVDGSVNTISTLFMAVFVFLLNLLSVREPIESLYQTFPESGCRRVVRVAALHIVILTVIFALITCLDIV